MRLRTLFSLPPFLVFVLAPPCLAQPDGRSLREAGPEAWAAYEELLAEPWNVVFAESGDGDWRERWTLDGLKAEVRTLRQGLFFQAGPIADDHASHAVLWTRSSFSSPVRVEFDFERMDTVNGGVCILYLLASGTGVPPYAEDISAWADLRDVPYMSTYFDHMHLLHVSFAAFGPGEPGQPDYVRARRYPRALSAGQFALTKIPPDYVDTGLFVPGRSLRIVAIKNDRWLFFCVSDRETRKLFAWDLAGQPPLPPGRIGIRHMFQRAAVYRNLRISRPAPRDY
jgi:hypothetical protein